MSMHGAIMIVDDAPDDQHLAKEVISSIGMANPVLPFFTALDALRYLMDDLSDINLPKMNGVELKKAIAA